MFSYHGFQEPVSAAHCQSVIFPDDRIAYYFYFITCLFYKFFDHSKLLKVFYAKNGNIGFDYFEKPAHNLCNTVKMAETVKSFHYIIEVTEMEFSFIFFRVNFFIIRSKYNIIFPEDFFKERQVIIKCSGVIFKVVFIVELCRVHINTHNNNRTFFYSTFNQRQVPFMKSPHGRHKTNRSKMHFSDLVLQPIYGTYHLHYMDKNLLLWGVGCPRV